MLNRENYIHYIQSPKVMTNPIRDVRLFENPILERFTMTPWYLIPLIWLPIVLANLFKEYE
jgi:hypothetical protein